LAGFHVEHIEQGREPSTSEHKTLAELYEVTQCWLAGYQPSPDLTDLQRQAEDKDVSFSDWREIVAFAQSCATCDECTERRGKGQGDDQ
jgi:hypothetical protein